MGVTVNVPVGVRLPQVVSPQDLADLERATGDATHRALEAIRDEVLIPRGRGRMVNILDRSVFFVRPMPDALRSAVEEAVVRGVDHGVSASALLDWHRPGTPVAALTHAPVEPFNASRVDGNTYRIPIFDDGTPGVITFDESEAESVTALPFDGEMALAAAWEAHKTRFGAVWEPTTYGYPGYYGRYVENGALLTNRLIYFTHVGALSEDGWPLEWTWQAGEMHMVSYVEENDTISTAALNRSMDHYVLTRTDEPATAANLLRHANESAADDAAHAEDVRARMAEEAADANATIWTLQDGERTMYMSIVPGTVGEGGIAHSPIRFIAEGNEMAHGDPGTSSGTADEASSGGSGGTGTGAGTRSQPRGGPLGTGTSEGEGSVWPTLGAGGEPLVCKPFLGEPPVDQLVVGKEILEREMRNLAAQLEVDYCAYAGKFCLNLARIIGARAHAIGMVSVNSSTRTTVVVHPEGSGNNGIVDIQPGDAPEFQYLRLLGDLAVSINQFAHRINDVYSAPANRHLIFWDEDHDLDPDPIAWALRFYGELGEALEDSCMWLFAETCRVLLLQQLRTSHLGIVQRQDNFEDTLQRFESALGILGESVVKLSVLRQAISHADDYNLTGSVRAVLSHEPPSRGTDREGFEYQPSAPIEFIASQIITLLEEATVESGSDGHIVRFQNRTWTDAELEQGIAMRRSFLNRADPMFLQVRDLDRLYMNFRSNPASSRTYLTNLLAEVRRANEEMTSETSDADDGPFFALEASQYVKAEGGWNSRGLKFDLHGLHQMADDILRPTADGTDAYRRGINKALGIKAGWDDFISVFSAVGIIAIAVLCAPLGVAAAGLATGIAGLALTAYDISEANRMEDLYRSLEDPEAVLAWQEVELQRLMANLSIAFSIFDVVGVGKGARAIVAGMRSGLREVAEQGVRGGARATLQAARRRVLENIAGEVLENAVRQAMSDAAIMVVMQAALPAAITPVLVPWMRSIAAEHGTLPEVDAALGSLAVDQPAIPAPATPATGATP
jgi:hypothetical protein